MHQLIYEKNTVVLKYTVKPITQFFFVIAY